MTAEPLLAGALDSFALADVLQLLELGARSGVLAVDGGPLGAGRVVVRAGRVVDVTTRDGGATAIADAVATLLELPRGRWAFHVTEPAEAGAAVRASETGVSISGLLVEAARGRDEGARLEAVRPLRDSDVLRLSVGEDAGTAPAGGGLQAAHLRVLAAVDGARDVRAIAAALRCEVDRVRDALDTLRALGLVDVAAGLT